MQNHIVTGSTFFRGHSSVCQLSNANHIYHLEFISLISERVNDFFLQDEHIFNYMNVKYGNPRL
jgi:hypothetical protein